MQMRTERQLCICIMETSEYKVENTQQIQQRCFYDTFQLLLNAVLLWQYLIAEYSLPSCETALPARLSY